MAPHARITAALLAAMWLAAGSLAGQPTGEGAKFYAEYRAAFAKAKAVEDIYRISRRAASQWWTRRRRRTAPRCSAS